MPSPKTKPKPLSDTEIEQIATDIAGGRPPMVWFTAAAVGIPEGRSGKVVALGDPTDGDFLQVRPTGSKDVLSFSPTEVTLTKPARGAAPVKNTAAAKSTAAVKTTAQQKSTNRKDSTVTQPSPVMNAVPSTPAPATSSATPPPAKPAAEPAKPAADKSTPAPAKAAKAPAAARAKAKSPEVTVTLTGTADGEWTVEVVSGKKKTVRGLPVQSSAVAQAAKLLHPEVAEVVAGILEAARGVQQAKVQQLQAELDEARRLLEDLSD